MTDEAGVGGQNNYAREGADPLIIFDRKSSMQKKSSKEITENEERASMQKYYKIMWRAEYSPKYRKQGQWSDI